MTKKKLLLAFLLFLCLSIHAQKVAEIQFSLLDQNNQPIPYAHVSHGSQLDAISDHNGRFSIYIQQDIIYEISCVGYQKFTFTNKDLTSDQTHTFRLTPDQKILDAVVITPYKLEDMIKEVYYNIPNRYQSTNHLLMGELKEYYMDTAYHTNIASEAMVQIAKASYEHKNEF